MNALRAAVTVALMCCLASAQSQQLQTVTLNFPTRSGASWPLFVAKEGGYYQKYGLDVTLVFAGHPAGIAMVVSDQAHMSSYNLESVMQASSRGDSTLTVVGASVNRPYFALMSRTEIASIADLKGKTIAVSQIGDPPYNYTSAFLRKFGLSARDVQWIAAGADANPDATGRPSPVVVRVYQLKTDASFNGAEFFALFDDDKKVLGAELISRDEFVLTPAERRTIEVVVSDETRFVGAIAAYRDIGHSQWRALAAAAPRKGLNIEVGRASVSLSLVD